MNALPRKVKEETIRYYKKGGDVSNSKFSPKKKVVYVLPTLDMCLALLPKDVGNHILSYTTAWINFMLLHILEKYGLAFLKKLIYEFVFPHRFIFKKTLSGIQIIKLINDSFDYIPDILRNNVGNNIKRGLDYRQQQIVLKQQKKIQDRIQDNTKKSEYKEYIKSLAIGGVYSIGRRLCIVVYKKQLSFVVFIIKEYEFLLPNRLNVEFIPNYEWTIDNNIRLGGIVHSLPTIYVNNVRINMNPHHNPNNNTLAIVELIKDRINTTLIN